MAVVMASVSDSDLAFQMQINEAIAASMGVDYNPGVRKSFEEEIGKDAILARRIQELELEALQSEELDRNLAAKVLKDVTGDAAQLLHDCQVAREIDEMSEDEWEQNGDLYERPYERVKQKEQAEGIYRVFFKGFSLSTDGNLVGGAVGGAVLDAGGNQLIQVKRYLQFPIGKNAVQYHALLDVLDAAQSLGARKIIAYTDSKPLYNQINGFWRMKTKTLNDLYEKAVDLIQRFVSFDLNLALHGENWPAENLARMAIVAQRQTVASSSKIMLHCIICMEDIPDEDIFTLCECSHKFCTSCVKQHVEATVTSGRIFPVPCPQMECGKKFTEEECRSMLSNQALQIFTKRIEEARIPEACRVYCPYPNCSELMDKRTLIDPQALVQNPKKVCGACKRQFCLGCRVPWHTYKTCAGYKRLPPELKDAEDAKLYRLAENQNWRQCKQCRTMIELSEGCYHMTCRCGHEFCYTCGADYRNKIPTCHCKLWDQRNIIRDEEPEDEEDDNVVVPPGFYHRYYKTQLCRYFSMGFCVFGADCRFAHGAQELRQV